jgi:hypothetical protein
VAVEWKAVIDDKAKYPDDATFTLAGENITFAELRRQNTASRGELEQTLTTRSQELDMREATQRRAVDTLARVLENVSARTGLSYDQLVKGEIPANMRSTVQTLTRETKTDAGVALRDDPLYKPLFESVLAPMQNDMNLVKTGLGQAIGAYKNDHTLLTWLNFVMTGDKPEGFNAKYEDALQVAVNKGYKDELGFPDVARAAKDLASPIAAKVDTAKTRKEGFDEGYKAARSEFAGQLGQPQPGTGGISFEPTPAASGGVKKVQTIREKLGEALADPTIQDQLFGGMVQ